MSENEPMTRQFGDRLSWQRLADRLLGSVRPFASERNALIDLPGPASHSGRWSDGLEGFARTFLLAAFRLGGAAPDEDLSHLAEWYATGLDAGTDPRSPWRWPTLEEKGQARVECASIAIALHESRVWIWDRLDERVRRQVIDWMAPMVGGATPNNNWIWFQNVTEAFLRSVGGPYRDADIARNLARTESWYVGDGWYSDGDAGPGQLRNFDYYNGWAMHLYPLWYCRMSGEQGEPELLARYRARLSRYLLDAQHLIGGDGAPLFHGRSLTYRFAMLAPFFAGEIFEATPLPPGRTRHLAAAVMRYFLANGAVTGAGLLPLGWHGEFGLVRQSYSGPGSPYWASKAFIGLLLPATHRVWRAAEEPVPAADVRLGLSAPGWVVSATHRDGIVRVANHGGDHAVPGQATDDDPYYARDIYTTHTGPDLGQPDVSAPVDSHTALVRPDGRASLRRPVTRLGVTDRVGVSRHQAFWPAERYLDSGEPGTWGPILTVASVLRGAVEVCVVRVDLPPDHDGARPADVGPWRLRVGGCAVADAAPPRAVLADAVAGRHARVSRPDGLTSVAAGRVGLSEHGVTRRTGANPFGVFSACPWVMTAAAVVPGSAYAALRILAGDDDLVEFGLATRVVVTSTVDHSRAMITWADGETDPIVIEAIDCT